ncbi:unnamed protein product [Acanthoscelides obtectus]|uniref:Transposase n=1 Tax=Acanthoscelides obtectus TaxID=200917 RepID=A0A9P0JNT7_ACAOB|nr:unnamed protein product [Acanthoscelides obtectus]CAK1672359.1 Histone-lysine N-methyltransferase SETMAR [Acanthoscelides obtectus]
MAYCGVDDEEVPDDSALRKLIIEDRHVTYREIEAPLKISIQKILHEELGQKGARVNWCQRTLDLFNSVNSKNVYSISAVWVFQGEENPTKVPADWFITELRKINPLGRIILHQDNASSHTAQKTRQYLTEENMQLLDHPLYSPDLSPNDFFTFPEIKNRLRGQRFQSPEEAVDALKNAVLDLPTYEWNECFENWFERMQMCINLRGEHFEQQ